MVSAKLRAQALPPKKKKKHVIQAPETANEFLAAGVEEENGGEKWRSGDIVKSARFFTRALDHYKHGIQKFPQDFDLAYNHARLQYDICKQPRLLEAFREINQCHDQDMLQLALSQHEAAYQLKQDDIDLNFNIGQLYRDVAEQAEEAQNDAAALQYLDKALQMLGECVNSQVSALQNQESTSVPDSSPPQSDEDTSMETEQGEAVEDDQWFTEVKPVTPAVIYETLLATLQCVTSIIPLATEQGRSVEKEHDFGAQYSKMLEESWQSANQIEDWNEEHSQWEYRLAIGNFQAASLDAACRQGELSPGDYSTAIWNLYHQDYRQTEPSKQWYADTAEADLSLNATLSIYTNFQGSVNTDVSALPALRWKHIGRALELLTTLSGLGGDTTEITLSLSEVHARRADCELLRRRMCEPENGALQPPKTGLLLAKNAEVYYRGARNLAKRDGEDFTDFHAREVITNRLAGGNAGLPDGLIVEAMNKNLAEMMDEGLIRQEEARALT